VSRINGVGPGLVLMTLALFVAGCGDSLNLKPATGTVTYQGKPLDGASVTFLSSEGKTASGATDSDGKFTIYTDGKPGALVGKHSVGIIKSASTVSVPTGSASTTGAPPGKTPPPGAGAADMVKMAQQTGRGESLTKPLIPVKYGTPQGSGLTADVTADGAKNVFDFTLED